MPFELSDVTEISVAPDIFLNHIGHVFFVFDERTQDSGNISYGVRIGEARYFVKTAGRPDNMDCRLRHEERAALLWNGKQLWEESPDPALARIEGVIAGSPHGPLFFFEWLDGEVLGASTERREDSASAYQRFRRLPPEEIAAALDTVFALHARLAEKDWIAVDFYDCSLLYDFERKRIRVIDLDNYRKGPFTNVMGRMFGSSRFMAPEEFTLGAVIDQRATVFTMGCAAAIFLSNGTLDQNAWRGSDASHAVVAHACEADPNDRYSSAADFYAAWREGGR